MRTHGLFCLAVFTLAGACFAQEPKGGWRNWVYPCPSTATPPVIDGRIDDEAYKNAPVAGGFTDYHNPGRYVDPAVTFRVVHDWETLYFAFRCVEPQLDKIPVIEPQGRDAIAAHGETVEIFLDADHDHKDYHQWIPEINGNFYDGRGWDKSWDSQIEFATHRGVGYWSVEVAIPLQQLGVEKLAQWQVVGMGLVRNRWLGSPQSKSRYWATWQSYHSPHTPSTLDHLVICAEKAEIPPDKLAELMPVMKWDNPKTGPHLVVRPLGISGSSYSDLGGAAVAKSALRVKELELVAGLLTKHAEELKRRLGELESRVPSLDPGTHPLFMLEVDRLAADTDTAYWASRTEALLQVFASRQ